MITNRTAVIALCLAALASTAPAQPTVPRVTSVKVSAQVDRSGPCRLSVSATITTSGNGTVWYRFLGPPGATFDFGPEGTFTLTFDNSFGSGKGVAIAHDISGEFKAEAAMVGPDGQHGPVTVSNSVPANYTCGSGKDIATPVTAAASIATPPPSSNPGFAVTAAKAGDYSQNYNGSCPTDQLVFRWELIANGPGDVVIRFTQQGRPIREETVTFAGPGSKTVVYQAPHMGAPGGHYQGWIGLEVLSPNKLSGDHEPYTMQCAPRVK